MLSFFVFITIAFVLFVVFLAIPTFIQALISSLSLTVLGFVFIPQHQNFVTTGAYEFLNEIYGFIDWLYVSIIGWPLWFKTLLTAISVLVGYIFSSVLIIKEGNAAIVERLGRYRRTLSSGVHIKVPILDSVVLEDTLREQTISSPPREAFTRDNFLITVEVFIVWKILDIKKTFYLIEDIDYAITELISLAASREIAVLDFESVFTSQNIIEKSVMEASIIDTIFSWGVQITQAQVQCKIIDKGGKYSSL